MAEPPWARSVPSIPDRNFEAELLDRVEAAVVVLSVDGTVIHANREAEGLYGWSREAALGRPVEALLEIETAHRLLGALTEMHRGEGWEGEVVVTGAAGSAVPTYTKLTPLVGADGQPSGAVWIAVDISERQRTERLRDTELQVAQILAGATSLGEATPPILRAVCNTLDWQLGELWILDNDAGVLRRVQSWQAPGLDVARFQQVSEGMTFGKGVGLQGRVWEEGRPIWTNDILKDPALRRKEAAAKAGLRAAFGYPIFQGEEFYGAMVFFALETREPDTDLLHTMATIGNQIGTFMMKHRALRDRARTLQILQKSLLPPKLPLIVGLDMAARYLPAREEDVGGDFYDVFPVTKRSWMFTIGDVVGKGPEVAGITALARHTIRAAAIQERRLTDMLMVLNEALRRDELDLLLTIILGKLQFTQLGMRITLACAGHPFPYVVRRDGSAEPVGRFGTLLGAFAKPELVETHVRLRSGDAIVLYTDGITPRREGGSGVDEARLAALLEENAGADSDQLLDRLVDAVLERRPEELADDVALLAIRVIP
jgi:PAS domain S-box-containing protein